MRIFKGHLVKYCFVLKGRQKRSWHTRDAQITEERLKSENKSCVPAPTPASRQPSRQISIHLGLNIEWEERTRGLGARRAGPLRSSDSGKGEEMASGWEIPKGCGRPFIITDIRVPAAGGKPTSEHLSRQASLCFLCQSSPQGGRAKQSPVLSGAGPVESLRSAGRAVDPLWRRRGAGSALLYPLWLFWEKPGG